MSNKISDFFTPEDFAKIEQLARTLASMEEPLEKLNIYLAKTSRFMINALIEASERQYLIYFTEKLKAIKDLRRSQMLYDFVEAVKSNTHEAYLSTIDISDKMYIRQELRLFDDEMPEARELNDFEKQMRHILQEAIHLDLVNQYRKTQYEVAPTTEDITIKM